METGWDRSPAEPERRYSMMVRCLAGRGGIQKVSFFPAYINRLAEPEFVLPDDPRFREVLNYTEQWCRELGTKLTVEGDEVVVYNASGR